MLFLDGFKNWEKTKGHGRDILIETPPFGIDPLPEDPFYQGMVDSAFVTSYTLAELKQLISLENIGLTLKLMALMMPFNFVCKVM